MCYKRGDHIILLLDQYKNTLDIIPTVISQSTPDLMTLDLVELKMMEDVDYRSIIHDINRYANVVDIPDTLELSKKRYEHMAPAKNTETELDCDDDECSDYSELDNIIMELNANAMRSKVSSVSVSDSDVVYESDTDSSESSKEYDVEPSESSEEEVTMVSTLDNPILPSSEIITMIKDENLWFLMDDMRRRALKECKSFGARPRVNLFALKLFPDMPKSLKRSFHHNDNTILKMLDEVYVHYGGNHRYYFFEAYVLNAIKQAYGNDNLNRARNAVKVKNQALLEDIEDDSVDSDDDSIVEGGWYANNI
jgi:hypothetical protein